MDVTSYLLGKKAGSGGDTPTGTIDITQNGTYNVSSYASADVDVQPDLESKSVEITTNTTTTITPTQGKDGLSSVEVTTNVPGIVPTGTISITSNGTVDVTNYASADVNVAGNKFAFVGGGAISFSGDTRSNLQPEIDNIVANVDTSTIYKTASLFASCSNITTLDFKTFNSQNVKNYINTFQNCRSLTSLNLSSFETMQNATTDQMFYGCTNLTRIDMRSFDFTKVSTYANMFNSVPTNCLIIVKDATQKQWMNTNFSIMTNVKTVAEYEGS